MAMDNNQETRNGFKISVEEDIISSLNENDLFGYPISTY